MQDKDKGRCYLDHIRGTETDAAIPLLGRVVQHVIHPEPIILRRQFIQIIFHEDILEIDIGKYQIHLRRIPSPIPRPTPHHRPYDLQHRRDACAARDHSEMSNKSGRVHHGAFRAFDFQGLSDA